MKSCIFIKLISITLLTLILFSCGTGSNVLFEKRKHLNGWHFKKKSISFTSDSKNERHDFKIKTLEEDSDLIFLESDSLQEFKSADSDVFEEKSLGESANKKLVVSKEVGNILFQNKVGFSSNFSDQSSIGKNITNNRENPSFIERKIDPLNKRAYTPFQHFIRMAGIVLLSLIFAGLLVVLTFLIIEYNLVLGFIVLGIGLLIGSVYYDYFTMRLKYRALGNYEWTLKESFKRILLMYLFITAAFLLLFFVGYLMNGE